MHFKEREKRKRQEQQVSKAFLPDGNASFSLPVLLNQKKRQY